MCLNICLVLAIITVIVFNPLPPIQCATVDYCKIEKTMCYQRRHVGCNNNATLNSNVPLKKVDFSPIVDFVNGVRRDNSKTFNISNMNLVAWNKELGALAEQKIIKPEPDCYATNQHDKVYMYSKEFEGSGFFIFLQSRNALYMYNEEVKRSTLFFMNPETTAIGCAAYFKDNIYIASFDRAQSPPVVLICLLNGIKADDYTGMYKPGEPCSACTACDNGLCIAVPLKSNTMYKVMFNCAICILIIIVYYLIVAISVVLYFIYKRKNSVI